MRVPAALLHRRAEHVAAVGARDEVGVAAPGSCARPGRARCGSRRRSTWPLTGRTGTASGHALEPRDVRAGGEHDRVRGDVLRRRRAPRRSRARRRAGAASPACRGRTFTPARRTASPSAATSRRGSTEWSPATSSARRTVGRERRLGAAGGARQQALDGAARGARGRRAAGRAPPPRRGRARPRACPPPGSRDRMPVSSASSAQKAGNPAAARSAEAEQRVLAELRLGHRRQHAGGDVPGAGLAGVEHGDAQAALRRAPRASRGRSARRRRRTRPHAPPTLRAPSLRRHDPDQVRRSAARCRPLSPSRAPVCPHLAPAACLTRRG